LSSTLSVSWLSNQFETCFSISARTDNNPSMAKALRNWQRWSIPADKEMDMLHDMNLYEEVAFEDVPRGVQILPTKMDFKTKFDSRGTKIKDKCHYKELHGRRINLIINLMQPNSFCDYGWIERAIHF
jgi:hypothetical protein